MDLLYQGHQGVTRKKTLAQAHVYWPFIEKIWILCGTAEKVN